MQEEVIISQIFRILHKYWWYIIEEEEEEEEDHALPRPHLRLKYVVAIRDGFFTLCTDQVLGV
jgi:hypothetical protein